MAAPVGEARGGPHRPWRRMAGLLGS
jgi:hypothetical protein